MQTPTEVLDHLKAGNARFVADETTAQNRDRGHRETLKDGQAPIAIVLSCADSRVVPELAFDTGIGELFVVRVAGNVANTTTIGTIEYAVAHLGVPLVVVMGHENCGAVSAAMAGGDAGPNLNHLLAHITPALAAAPDGNLADVIRKNAELNAEGMLERSKILREGVASGQVAVVPAYYELDSGTVTISC
jgi:carbonic anhydrase